MLSHEALVATATAHPNRSAAALVIGNELLSGKVHDQNIPVLARAMRSLGIDLQRVVMIQDQVPTIVREVRALSGAFDQVFTSGGVGPTHDDVTIAAVAEAFDTVVETNPELARMIEEHFGEGLVPGHLRMARVPRGCDLVASEGGKWPTVRIRNVWVLPGVPEIFRARLQIIKPLLAQGAPFVSRSVYSNLDEGHLVPMLDEIVSRFPSVDVGSYPKWNETSYRTQITFDGTDPAPVDAAVAAFVAMLPPGEPQRVA